MARKGYRVFLTARGWIAVAATEMGVCGVVVPRATQEEAERELLSEHPAAQPVEALPWDAEGLFQRYMRGEDSGLDALPLDLSEGTVFQRAVWVAARHIPFGQVQTYNWLAQHIGKPGASRAVGRALGANPVPIVVPCHRVLGADGGLHGFKGGLHLKVMLLACEGRMLFSDKEYPALPLRR